MKKMLAALMAMTMLMFTMAGVADAQEPTGTMTADPPTVDAAGDHEFTITLGDFTPGTALFVLPCTAPPGGDMAQFDAASACDQSQLSPVVADDDGNGTVTATYAVSDDGLVIVAGDAARTEFGITIIPPVGAGGGEALADTGVETGLLAVVATALVAGGAMVVRQTRRFT